MTKDRKTPASLRAAFMQHLTQALKTKTGAVQTQAVKRIFYLAVRDLPDEVLADLSLQLDYTPRGMQPAYYVSYAEAMIGQLILKQGRKGDISASKAPNTMQAVLAKMALR